MHEPNDASDRPTLDYQRPIPTASHWINDMHLWLAALLLMSAGVLFLLAESLSETAGVNAVIGAMLVLAGTPFLLVWRRVVARRQRK